MCSIDRLRLIDLDNLAYDKINMLRQDMLHLHPDTYHMLHAVSCSPALRAIMQVPPRRLVELLGLLVCIRQLPTFTVAFGNFLRNGWSATSYVSKVGKSVVGNSLRILSNKLQKKTPEVDWYPPLDCPKIDLYSLEFNSQILLCK